MRENSKLLINFGKQVQKRREFLGLNKSELADNAGLDRTYIGGIERGERNPTLTTMYKLAKALQLKPEKLLPKN
ncbi:XRE family transcriptional regulator [Candidatus Saccharibacteria bacterium CPR2]|nr:XRE family transcriptional regulator [Candidatus Saccharibacteria bacterium CPR2]